MRVDPERLSLTQEEGHSQSRSLPLLGLPLLSYAPCSPSPLSQSLSSDRLPPPWQLANEMANVEALKASLSDGGSGMMRAQVRLFPNASNCFQLLPIASDCFRLLPSASECFRVLPSASECF